MMVSKLPMLVFFVIYVCWIDLLKKEKEKKEHGGIRNGLRIGFLFYSLYIGQSNRVALMQTKEKKIVTLCICLVE